MDSSKLAELKEWLLESDNRDFAAVVIRNGYIVLEVERGNSAKTDSRRVASVSKAVCATVLAIASQRSQQGTMPKKMIFDDLAFDFIPWAQPLSDPRKGRITVRQLLNHTSGICPEVTGADNDGTWEYVLGHSGDERTANLAFDDLARIAYCMLRDGRWQDQQVIPKWFVGETVAPTHDVRTPELRWKVNPEIFSHSWELPSRHWPASGRNVSGIPADARYEPGSGGQLIVFVPSLDLVITRLLLRERPNRREHTPPVASSRLGGISTGPCAARERRYDSGLNSWR